jgi:hypothetical protein
MEGHAERVTAGSEDGAAVTIDGGPEELVMARHRRRGLLAVRGPQASRVLDVGEAERHRAGRRPQRRAPRRPIDPQPLVVAEDRRLQLTQARTGFDPERFDEVVAGPAVRGERIGLASHSVERRHQQRPEPLPEGMVRRELGQRADGGRRVGLDAPGQMELDGAEPLLDQRIHRRGEAVGIEPGQGRSRPLPQRRLDVARGEQSLETGDVDVVGVEVEPVGGTGARDRVGAQALAETRHVRLQRLVGRARRLRAPHDLDQA